MNKFENVTKPLRWFIALLMVALMVGCGGSSDSTPIVNPGDTVAPTVTTTAPSNAATAIALNANVTATFSELMDAATISSPSSTFTLAQSGTPVTGVVTYSGMTAVFNPTGNLIASVPYTATVSAGAKDVAGNALAAAKVWSFTTGAAVDVVAPTVSSTAPADAATGVALNANIIASFDELMDASTVTDLSYTLAQSGTPVTGVVSYLGTSATFNPTSDLAASSVYTATVLSGASGVADLAGNTLAVDKVWSFTTGAVTGAVVCGGASGTDCVDLQSAANYVILDEATVTFTPIATVSTTATITGDVAVSPAAASFMTGFALALDPASCFSTSTQVVGKLYAADYSSVNGCATSTTDTATILTAAIGDKNNAYSTALGKPLSGGGLVAACPGTGAFDGGVVMPLAAGVYNCGVNVTIPTNFTLNGNATDVWVFQITGSLAQAGATSVLLTGGALPQNVFWIVSSGVSIGANAHMEGVVMSATDISLLAGASVKGRLLARTGVLMDSNTVVQP